MRKILFTLLFLLITQVCFADPYYVYIRLEDRFGTSDKLTAGRSKKGDIVDIRSALDTVPSEKEKESYSIVKIDLDPSLINTLTQPMFDENDEIIAYRLKKIDIDRIGFQVGLSEDLIKYNTIKNDIKDKTLIDIAYYKMGTLWELAKSPFKRLDNKIVPNAWAAENISTINKTGEDYNTLTLWEDAKDGDITAGNSEVAECYDDDGVLSDSVIIGGWTTDSDSKIIIRAPSGERHLGVSGGGFVLQNDSGGDSIEVDSGDYFELDYIEIDGNGSGYFGVDATPGAGGGDHKYTNLIIRDQGDTASDYCMTLDTALTSTGWNLMFWGCERAVYSTGAVTATTFYNATAFGDGNNDYGIMRINCINCYSGGYTTADFFQMQASTDYTVSSDTTSAGTNQVDSQSSYSSYFENVTTGTEDLRLKNDSNSLWGLAGSDKSGTFTTDIEGETRSAWDIGADEYIAAGGVIRRIMILTKNRNFID